jgi:RND superfamily putative drug exporter
MSAHRSPTSGTRPLAPTGGSVTRRLAHAAAVHPWRIVAAWLLVLAASVVAIGGLLGSALNSDASLTTHPESVRAEETLESNFPQSGRVDEAVVVRSPQYTTDEPAFRQFVADLRASIEQTGAARTIGDPFAGSDRGAISTDRHAALVTLTLGADPETGLDAVLERVVATDSDPAFAVDMTGTYTLDHDFNELSTSDLQKGELQFGLPAAMIVLLLVFGAVVAALVPMTIAIASIIVAVATTSVLGQVTSLSFFIVNMITAMGLALGIDYSLFVLSRYREERTAGKDKVTAIVATGGTSSKAVLFSGTSFVVALLGLLLVPDTILRSLALGAIIVGIVTMAAALTLLPALLSLLGDRVDAVRLPFLGRTYSAESPFWSRAVSAVVRHPATALTAGLLILVAATVPVLGMRTGSAGVESLPDRVPSKAGALALERSFPDLASDPAQVVISGDVSSPDVVAAMARFESSIADDNHFGPAVRQVAPNGAVALISVPLRGDPNSSAARTGLDHLRGDLVPAAFDETRTDVLVGGTTAENTDYSDVINKWLPIVLTFVLGLSFVLLTLVFRSVVLSATAVVLNLLSVGAAYGLLVLVFQDGVAAGLLGFQRVERVEAWVPVFLFSVLFALSMDYHVFLLSRIRERYAQTGDTRDAVVHGIAATGRIITGAALIIVVVFAGFAAGDLVMFQQMGFGVAIALLVDATLIRMVIVPAVMTVLGRWNWYLPSWLDWLPEMHVEGDPLPAGESQAAPPGPDRLPV